MTEMPFLDGALVWVAGGCAVFPCKPLGKEPITKHGFRDASRDEAQIARWRRNEPGANIGLATGAASNIIVVDIDCKDGKDGQKILDALEAHFGKLPPTLEVETPSGGRHLYFRPPEGCGRVPSSTGDGLDIRADDAYAVAPPSVLGDGARYIQVEGIRDPAVAPDWLIDFARNRKAILKAAGLARNQGGLSLRPKGKRKPAASRAGANDRAGTFAQKLANTHTPSPWSEVEETRLGSALAEILADDRTVWLKVGGALHDLVKDDPRWAEAGRNRALWDAWSRTCPEKFNPADQERAWASFARDYDGPLVTVATIYHLAHEAGWSDPTSALTSVSDEAPSIMPKGGVDFTQRLRTDANNALMFLDLFGEDLRFVEKWGCWLAWNGSRWVEVSDLALLPLARQATEVMLRWAAAQPWSNRDREPWIKHAIATQKDRGLRAMVGLAKGEARARVEPDALDADSWLLGCPNGTLDLKMGKLREARRQDFITKQIGVAFDAAADCPQWCQFLNWAMQGDVELVEFLQTFAGYALTGEVSEEKMCAAFGDGANGKSTFLMTLFDLWDEYASKARSDLLVNAQGKEGAPSPDVAALHGKRLVIVSETEDGCYLSEARIKDIVSNEIVAARRLHRDPFTFRPTHKIMLGTNYQPHVRGTDAGIWRRLAIVPFVATIEEERKAADFRERILRPEQAGILNWAVHGLKKWKRDGLRLPASVRAATAEYRSAMDSIAQWIEERTDADPASIVPVRFLHDDYVSWLGAHARPFGGRRFSEELERKGFPACKLTGGARARRGLKLKPTAMATRLQMVR